MWDVAYGGQLPLAFAVTQRASQFAMWRALQSIAGRFGRARLGRVSRVSRVSAAAISIPPAGTGMVDVPSDAIIEIGATPQEVQLVPLTVHRECRPLARSMRLIRDCAMSQSLERAS
jgi:hypothetical protein